jgi:hypothetical protein
MKNTHKNTAAKITLKQASDLLGRSIVGDSFCARIEWGTPTHKIKLWENLDGVLCVEKMANAWIFGSENRRGRPKSTHSFSPSAEYVKSLNK